MPEKAGLYHIRAAILSLPGSARDFNGRELIRAKSLHGHHRPRTFEFPAIV